ncbi:GIY-YIG nuclease family protein [Streptomyces sp. NPDC056652]|uniref:GIY-YIG nuclease family protein n=1 Tax=Streptomyces sp. NPDC056652 TaxID=3345893 RepID=UPI0036CA5A57
MSHRPNNEPTALYRLYDDSDVLLYLGISFSPEARWGQHRNEKHWAHQVVRTTVEWYPTRKAALAAEEKAAAAEKPLHDSSWRKTGGGERPMWLDLEGQQKVVDGLAQEIEHGQHWMGRVLMSGAVGKQFGVSRATASNAMRVLRDRGLLEYRHYGRYSVLEGPTKTDFDKQFEVAREQRELRQAYLVWTVAELREAMKDLPEDTLISARLAGRPSVLPGQTAPDK